MQRVQKILSNNGFCSRRKAEELIIEGRVKVNDKVITIGDKASDDDRIYVDDRLVTKEKKAHYMLNKPLRCVTALTDKFHKTIMDYVNVKERVYPVGRLDYNTSGLIILTNDGDLANRIMHPRNEVKKTYVAEIDRPISKKEMRVLENGVELEDGLTSPAKINKIEDTILEISIHEGKNRIIRRMLKKVGFKVKSLKRTRIGSLDIGELRQGRLRNISKKEIKKIFID